jgi:hypothetical protein
MKKKPEIHSKKSLGNGKWLKINELEWQDSESRIRHWETCERVNSRGAVMIIALIKQSDELILVKQFRPPAAKYVIEFPAGLVDPGEDASTTAVRELYEETGYHGNIIEVSDPAYSSPGMSGEMLITVRMEVNGDHFSDGSPESCQEDSEDIETVLVKRSKLKDFLKAETAAGNGVDAKLQTYASAIC